jgi:lysophospholipase L1-like esterase
MRRNGFSAVLGVLGVLAFGSSAVTSCYPGSSNPPPTRYYVSMGDSLSTGTGVSAGQGYVDRVFVHESMRLPGLVAQRFGCAGATTTSMVNGGGCSYAQGSQLAAAEAFLSTHQGQIAFVTIDIGANDVTPCFSATGVNQTCLQTATATVQANLATILAGLRSAGGPDPIFGMTYYDPFLAIWLSGNQSAATQSEQATVSGNAQITSLYQSNAAQVADVQTTFDTTNFAVTGTYNGMTVPQNVANICAWTLMCPAGNIHANATGYQLIADTFDPLIDTTVSP